jgi:hypothetical protein
MNQLWPDLKMIGLTILGFGMFASAIAFSVRHLRRRHASSVFVLAYFFALSSSLTLGVGLWATSKGAIRPNGTPNGLVGEWILSALKATMDLPDEFGLFLAVAAAAIVPQMIAYILAGLAGCADRLWKVNDTIGLLSWSFAKSFVVAGGALSVTEIYGWLSGWPGMRGAPVVGNLLLSMMLVMYGVVIVFFHCQASALSEWLSQRIPRGLLRMHRKATIYRRLEHVRDARRRQEELDALAARYGPMMAHALSGTLPR